MLEIKFIVAELSLSEARALVAMLTAAYPDVVTKGPPAIGPDLRSNIEIRKHELANSAAEPGNWEDAANDEMLRTMRPEEPDAAAAFGGNGGSAGLVAPASSGIELDAAGIPWDERIHASTKTKTANGQWTRRRNTPDATYDAVMAELKGGSPLSPAPVTAPPPPTTAPAPSPAPAVAAASSSAPVAGIDPASPTAFPDIMKKVTMAQAAGKVTTEWVQNTVESIGGTPKSITALMGNKSLIPAFEAMLDAHVASQG